MDSDDLRWLLQTIETPEMAERFVLAQYKHGRISAHVIAKIGLEPDQGLNPERLYLQEERRQIVGRP
jgi:hypothetical protein